MEGRKYIWYRSNGLMKYRLDGWNYDWKLSNMIE